MQNFPNSPAPPPPGFPSRGGNLVGSPYPPHMSDPQISPRTTEEFAAIQQAHSILQSHGQHIHLRGQQQSGQASSIHGYGPRRGAGEIPQASGHSGSSSTLYRKESMDHYFSVSGRDRNRRGGTYGAGFCYPNMDGHVPHQYRHASGSGSSSGMVSPYPMDYSTSAASGSGSGNSSGSGSFSPSQQFSMAQNTSIQTASGAEMHQRHHSQKYLSHQGLHQGHRAYSLSGHRIPSQFGHYPSLNAPTAPGGIYNSPPQRYEASSAGSMDSKINNSPTHSNPNSSTASNNSGHQENVGQPYSSSSHPPYSPQSHPVHKHASRRTPQHSVGGGYDASLKIQHAASGQAHPKNPQSSSPAAPHQASQDMSKSPVHSQNQQTLMNQNFSPISNPSPAPSAVHSPSCSSSSSPLMGVSEGLGNSAPSHCPTSLPPSHSSLLNPRSSHNNVKPSHTVPQLSPTPSSNSSISSCGSSAGSKATGLNPNVVSSAMNQSLIGVGPRSGQREEGSSSLFPQDKLSQDPGLNSLNALTSQVANLPNTVQHMLLTHTVLSHKRGRDSAHQSHSQHPAANQQKPRNTSGHITANEESGDVLGSEQEEAKRDQGEPPEHDKVGPMARSSAESKPTTYYQATQSQNQTLLGQNRHGLTLQMESRITEASVKQSFNQLSTPCSQTKTPETQTPSSSSPPSVPPFAEPSPNAFSCPHAPSATSSSTSSPTHSMRSNCVADLDLGHSDDKSGLRDKISLRVKDEGNLLNQEEDSHEVETDKVKHTQDIISIKVEHTVSSKQNKNEKDDKKVNMQHFHSKHFNTPEQPNVGVVGVIVSARSEQNPETTKQTETTSPYGPSYHLGKLSYSEDKHSINMFRDSGSHNGEREIAVETYTAQYDVSPKTEFGQGMSSNHCHTGSFKYNNPDLPYNACMGAKNKGRAGPGGVVGANRYQDYSYSQYTFGAVPRKDAGVLGLVGRGGVAIGSRGQDNSSQMQQPYPSLLQEVLQGYHLDRRYGRPEQVSSAHHQPKNMSQAHYHTRLPYRMIENMRSHGVGQSVMASSSIHHQLASGKPRTQNQSQGPDHELGQSLLHSSWDSDVQRPKSDHGMSSEKGATNLSPSYSTHMQQSSDPSAGTPPKHINLADYSLPHRKPPSLASPPSAVQQLLLQEADSLTLNAETINQTQSQMSSSSGRRSVICDVSPSRRTTPERERGTSGSSVIQQPLSCSVLNEQGCSKEDVKDKKQQETEDVSKIKVNPSDSARPTADVHSSMLAKEEPSKTVHAPTDVNSDTVYRHSGSKGSTELPVNPSYHSQHHLSSDSLTSPARRKTFSQAADGCAFSPYGFGDTVDGSKVNTHHPSHNPFHALSSASHIQSSANKLQAYPHSFSLQRPQSMDDRFDWTANSYRPKDISVQNSDQKCKMQSPPEGVPNQHQLSRQHSYPGSQFETGSQYDMKMWESLGEREGAASQHSGVPPESAGSQMAPSGPQTLEVDVSRGMIEEPAKSFHPPAVASVVGSGGSNVTPGAPQGPRPTKTGGSAETNPLMMRRRVRSFISPIPAKRQHQDFSNQRSGSSYHSPVPHTESRQLGDSDTASVDPRPKLASPSTPVTNSPPQGKTKILPPRKGRGLKLEAIVQKITPSKKSSYNNSHVDTDYSDVSHYSSDIPDPEIGAPFSSASHREGGCLPYLDEAHSLDDIMPYRAEDAYSCDSQVLKQNAAGSTSGSLRNVPTDFDFGLGTAGSGAGSGTGESDKDEFTLLGPLPPPPPLPRPVQGSPPPSSSALSDIQQFTSTYQQLETRRGEQSAANLLRQKLQESGMGFDDYGGGDFYGATPPHSQSPGHHLLSRGPHLGSTRMTASDSKASETLVPKGYFPSGKKKGRPVGSVNKQKRAQGQVQNPTAVPAAPQTPPAAGSAAVATPQSAPNASTAGDSVTASTLPDEKPCPSVDLADQTEPVKEDIEGEDKQPEADAKSVKHRQKKGKEGNERTNSGGRQFRRRRGLVSKEELDPLTSNGGNAGLSAVIQDARKNVFSPYIHVERKIAEIGAVCTIVNSEEEKTKGGGKGGTSAVEGPSTVSLVSQTVKKERETERMQEKGITEQTDSVQSGKSLPTSGYVLPGPVVSETGHTGRFLCCLCQKWANYKNLGDLYGPFYPAEYAAKFPKNQPQIRQILSSSGAANTGQSVCSVSAELPAPETQFLHSPDIKSAVSECTVSQTTNPTSPVITIGTASPEAQEVMPCLSAKVSDDCSKSPVQSLDLTPEVEPVTLKPPDLENELSQKRQLKTEDLQQRPQHRKLTSHPRFKRRHKSSEDLPRTIPINSKASLPFQPPPPSLDSLGPLAQLAQLPLVPIDPEELWVHESCIVWTSGIYLVNGRLYGLQEALDGARETVSFSLGLNCTVIYSLILLNIFSLLLSFSMSSCFFRAALIVRWLVPLWAATVKVAP